MNADVKGALNQIDKSWKAFTHEGYNLTKPAVKRILEYALAKGYEHTGQIRDSEIDHLLNKGTTIEQWERYYEESAAHEKRCKECKPQKEDMDFVHPDNGSFMEEKFNKAYSEWQMMWSCDAPNKPGYYRANND